MITSILNSSALAWTTLGVVLVVVEIMTPAFGFVLVGGAAFLAAAVAAFGGELTIQLIVFAVALVFSFVFLRPRLIAKLYPKNDVIKSRNESLIGKKGVITEVTDDVLRRGRVLVDGEDWACEGFEAIEVHQHVLVDSVDGIILKVKKQS